ncbi:TetR/AcrR family transcriptional regulator [Eggerthella sp. AM16-19]|nr:TetR/AcrR family transcriptional regulator [Eggerthella sp. AM16-19]
MIDERGYEKFSIRALADELGIGTMSVYTYVPSKKQLLFLVLAKMRQNIDNKPIPGEYWEIPCTAFAARFAKTRSSMRVCASCKCKRKSLGPWNTTAILTYFTLTRAFLEGSTIPCGAPCGRIFPALLTARSRNYALNKQMATIRSAMATGRQSAATLAAQNVSTKGSTSSLTAPKTSQGPKAGGAGARPKTPKPGNGARSSEAGSPPGRPLASKQLSKSHHAAIRRYDRLPHILDVSAPICAALRPNPYST